MKRMTIILVALAGASLVAVGAYRMGRGAAPGAVEEPATPNEVHSIERSVDDARLAGTLGSLQRRMAELEQKQAAGHVAEDAVPSPAPAAHEPEPFDPAKEEDKRLERLAAVDAAVRMQSRDTAWSSPTEGSLRVAVDSAVSEGAKFTIKDLKCLTSVCEMILTAPTPEELGYVAQQLAPKITGMHSLDVSPPTSADGRATVTCRFFRQGYPRPDEGIL